MLKDRPPTQAHMDLLDAFKQALADSDLPATDKLSVASQIVGALLALQDRDRITFDEAHELVAVNIEMGNTTMLVCMQEAAGGLN